MPQENYTAKFRVDVSDLKKGIKDANDQIKKATAEFKNATAGMDKWSDSIDGVTAKIDEQTKKAEAERKKLDLLKQQLQRLTDAQNDGKQTISDLTAKYEEAAATFGETSEEAKKYAKQLGDAEAAQKRNKEAAEKLELQIINQDTAVKNAQAQVEKFTDRLSELQAEDSKTESATEKLTDTVDKQQTELDQLKQKYQDVVIQQGKNSDEAKRLGDEIDDLSTDLAENKQKLKDAADAADDFDNSLEDTSSGGISTFSIALGNLVADVISNAISKMKELVENTITVGETFDTSMSKVAALSGASDEDMEMLRDTAKEYGATTQYSASQAADALGYMALAGWNAQESADGLGGVLNLAAASQMDLAQASDLVTDYLSAFGLQASDSAKFADILAYAQSKSNTTTQALGEAFKNSAANMNAAGQDVETTTALLAMLANQGLKGSEAGTALTAVMRDMTAKMKDGSIAIGDTSVQVMDAQGNYRDLTDILADVEAATYGMGDAEKASALQSTFTSDSIKGLNLILNAGVDEAAAFEDELRNSGGTAEATAKIMNDNLGGDLTALGSKFEGIQLAIYEKFEPALRDGVDALSGLLDALSWVIDHASEIIGTIGAIAAAVGSYVAYTTALKIMENGWKSLTIVTKAQSVAQAALNTVMSLNPIGLVIAAIVGLVAAFVVLWKKSEAFRNFWKKLWDVIKKTASDTWKAISGFFRTAWDLIKSLWSGLVEFFSGIWEGIKTVFSVVADWLNEYVFQPIIAFFTPVIDFFKTAFEIIFQLAEGCWNLIKAIWEIVSAWFNEHVIDPVVKFFQGLWDAVSKAAKTAWETVKNIWNVVSTWFNDKIISPIKTFFTGMWDNLKTGASKAWEGIKTVFSPVADWFEKIFSKAWGAVKKVFSTGGKIFDGIKEGIVSAFKFVVNAIIRGINKVISVPFNAINNILDKIRNVSIAKYKPFEDLISRFDVPQIPELEQGGVLRKGQIGLLEGNGEEAVLPLERNTGGIKKIANAILENMDLSTTLKGITDSVGSAMHEVITILRGIGSPDSIDIREIAQTIGAEISASIRQSSAAQAVDKSVTNNYNFTQNNSSPKALSRWDIYRQTKNLVNAAKGV